MGNRNCYLEFDEQFAKEEFQTIVNVEEEDDGSMESKQDKMETLIICSHQIWEHGT